MRILYNRTSIFGNDLWKISIDNSFVISTVAKMDLNMDIFLTSIGNFIVHEVNSIK